MATNAGSKAEQVGDSASLEVLARVGLVAYAVVHLLIGCQLQRHEAAVDDAKGAGIGAASRDERNRAGATKRHQGTVCESVI